MPRYLSDEWFEAAQRALAERGPAAAGSLSVEHHVTGAPGGDVTFHLVSDEDGVRIARGAALAPIVTFTEDYETAGEIARGGLSAQGAFMSGRIRVDGDVAQLIEAHHALAGIEDALAELRAHTTY